jgi:glycogen debranching enzyme
MTEQEQNAQYAAEEAEYRVIDESVPEMESLVLKSGDQFAVFDRWGDILPSETSGKGLYRRDTRQLSRWELRLFGARPLLMHSGNRNPTTLMIDLTNPDYLREDGMRVEHNLLHIGRTKFMSGASCLERLRAHNFSQERQHVSLSIGFDADFHDIFEVRGRARAARGHVAMSQTTEGLLFEYTALDGVLYATKIRFHRPPNRLENGVALYEFDLAPKESDEIAIEVCCEGPPRLDTGARLGELLKREQEMDLARLKEAVSMKSSDVLFEQVVEQAGSDLYLLATETEHGLYPYAGVPWFSTVFGRDGIITALLAGWIDPAISRGVLRLLAATQAQEVDAASDAQPGKIVHEIRYGEMSRMKEVPFTRYYGTVDATPLFIILAANYVRQTNDLTTLREIWPNLERANAWIDNYGDCDGDGFVEYQAQAESGLANQGWKDSNDAISHADGHLAEGPIALCEVQAYTHLAKSDLASLARLMERPAFAEVLERQADDLRWRFDKAFWLDDLDTYAIALDGRKRPCRVRSSNAGHALFGGLALEARVPYVERTLLSDASFCNWGVRTLASDAARYNPMSYHNGSVWPHDNAMIALGLARYGRNEGVVRILTALYNTSRHMNLYRLPELLCGFASSSPGDSPTLYPVACSPQAWASAALFGVLQAALGLRFDAHNRTLLLDRPTLPPYMDTIQFTGLKIGNETLDLELHQYDNSVGAHVLRRSGDIDLIVIH